MTNRSENTQRIVKFLNNPEELGTQDIEAVWDILIALTWSRETAEAVHSFAKSMHKQVAEEEKQFSDNE